MMSLLFMVLTSFLVQDQTITKPGLQGEWCGTTWRVQVYPEGANPAFGMLADQVLSTMVQDPGNPKEPWEITTYRRSGESVPAFIQRHKATVDGVRDALSQ